jgi:RNA polymerase sigma factor (sigma-70 family)
MVAMSTFPIVNPQPTTAKRNGRAQSLTARPWRSDMPLSSGPQQPDVAALIGAARRSDEDAWTQLHRQFDSTLRSIARSRGLSSHDVEDAVQNTWIKLHARIDSIREPAAIAGWLATTVRRESLLLLQTHVREILTDDPTLSGQRPEDGPEVRLLKHELGAVLTRALATLPDRQRRLMALIAADASYEQIEAMLDMPAGSIGPIRFRCITRLRRHPELVRLINTT